MAFSGLIQGVWAARGKWFHKWAPFFSSGREVIELETLRLIARLTICFQRSREESKYEQAAEDFAYGRDAQAKICI